MTRRRDDLERVQGFTESVMDLGRTKIRFCLPKTDDMLIEAGRRLQKLAR